RVEHLETRFETNEESACCSADFDRAEGNALDHRRYLSELVGRIDLRLDFSTGSLFDTCFEPLEVLMRDIVDGGKRYLHRERLSARHGRDAPRRQDHEEKQRALGIRMHVTIPQVSASVNGAFQSSPSSKCQ